MAAPVTREQALCAAQAAMNKLLQAAGVTCGSDGKPVITAKPTGSDTHSMLLKSASDAVKAANVDDTTEELVAAAAAAVDKFIAFPGANKEAIKTLNTALEEARAKLAPKLELERLLQEAYSAVLDLELAQKDGRESTQEERDAANKAVAAYENASGHNKDELRKLKENLVKSPSVTPGPTDKQVEETKKKIADLNAAATAANGKLEALLTIDPTTKNRQLVDSPPNREILQAALLAATEWNTAVKEAKASKIETGTNDAITSAELMTSINDIKLIGNADAKVINDKLQSQTDTLNGFVARFNSLNAAASNDPQLALEEPLKSAVKEATDFIGTLKSGEYDEAIRTKTEEAIAGANNVLEDINTMKAEKADANAKAAAAADANAKAAAAANAAKAAAAANAAKAAAAANAAKAAAAAAANADPALTKAVEKAKEVFKRRASANTARVTLRQQIEAGEEKKMNYTPEQQEKIEAAANAYTKVDKKNKIPEYKEVVDAYNALEALLNDASIPDKTKELWRGSYEWLTFMYPKTKEGLTTLLQSFSTLPIVKTKVTTAEMRRVYNSIVDQMAHGNSITPEDKEKLKGDIEKIIIESELKSGGRRRTRSNKKKARRNTRRS